MYVSIGHMEVVGKKLEMLYKPLIIGVATRWLSFASGTEHGHVALAHSVDHSPLARNI